MNNVTKALLSGLAGAVVTTALHETIKRVVPDAPRVDLLGMQGIAKVSVLVGNEPPEPDTAYASAMAGDLISNGAYFGLVGAAPKDAYVATGAILGILAGLGAVLAPPAAGLDPDYTSRTPATAALTVALYTAGGLSAAALYRAIQ